MIEQVALQINKAVIDEHSGAAVREDQVAGDSAASMHLQVTGIGEPLLGIGADIQQQQNRYREK